ncbi:MAG: hypothetical protein NT039_02260 [Candidatus Berkelbacteria bacterium]|nr:hypothetical protein [Candidatus Berkelbacteria bacterium]
MKPVHFKTSQTVNQKLLDFESSDSRESRNCFVIYRNKEGYIGGYSSNCMIPDSTVYYFDIDGNPLGETYFGKYYPRRTKRVIEALKEQFPLTETIISPVDEK